MNIADSKLKMSVVLVGDPTGGFTSFFPQHPNIIAEGDSEDDAIKNLFELATAVFAHEAKEVVEEMNIDAITADNAMPTKVKTVSVELAAA